MENQKNNKALGKGYIDIMNNNYYLIHYGIKGMKWGKHKIGEISEEELAKKQKVAEPINNAVKGIKNTVTKNIDDGLDAINWNKPISEIISDSIESLKKDILEIKKYGLIESIKMDDLPPYVYFFAGSPAALKDTMKRKGDI